MTGILLPLPWSGAVVSAVSIDDMTVSGIDAAGYKLEADGELSLRTTAGGGYAGGGTWINPQTDMADYEARATLVELGDYGKVNLQSSAFNSWLPLTGDRFWALTAVPSGQTGTAVITVAIRRASTGVIVDAASITLDVTS